MRGTQFAGGLAKKGLRGQFLVLVQIESSLAKPVQAHSPVEMELIFVLFLFTEFHESAMAVHKLGIVALGFLLQVGNRAFELSLGLVRFPKAMQNFRVVKAAVAVVWVLLDEPSQRHAGRCLIPLGHKGGRQAEIAARIRLLLGEGLAVVGNGLIGVARTHRQLPFFPIGKRSFLSQVQAAQAVATQAKATKQANETDTHGPAHGQ